MGNRTNYGTGRMTVDNRQKNERSRSGNPYSSHVKAGKHAGTVYNFKRKSRIRKSLTRLPILLEFIHKYIFLNFVSFYNGLNSNVSGHRFFLPFNFFLKRDALYDKIFHRELSRFGVVVNDLAVKQLLFFYFRIQLFDTSSYAFGSCFSIMFRHNI